VILNRPVVAIISVFGKLVNNEFTFSRLTNGFAKIKSLTLFAERKVEEELDGVIRLFLMRKWQEMISLK
jgi:hypothetical protein